MQHLLLVGCGAMGGALLKGWMAANPEPFFKKVTVVTPYDLPRDLDASHVRAILPQAIDHTLLDTVDLVVFAVKPHRVKEILPVYEAFPRMPETIFLSVAAGILLNDLATSFPGNPCVRVMPNTPSQVGEGMSVAMGNEFVRMAHKKKLTDLFARVGKILWTQKESDFHVVTALSGSGPAYVFLLGEALEKAAGELGLSREMARALTTQMLRGAGIYSSLSPETLEKLRHQVTSPGGTTEAGLKVLLEKGDFFRLIKETLLQAATRSKELS
ncbi:pyrroline-5-carboxylate reductase [Alphaproteobacteria bacterium]|nr:pyrroline-5-carboxylate reductase [Alphaproteobacteria bacterium]